MKSYILSVILMFLSVTCFANYNVTCYMNSNQIIHYNDVSWNVLDTAIPVYGLKYNGKFIYLYLPTANCIVQEQ